MRPGIRRQIPQGMRAAAVPVNELVGVAGFAVAGRVRPAESHLIVGIEVALRQEYQAGLGTPRRPEGRNVVAGARDDGRFRF